MAVELNTFFLKFCLCIPPRNPLIVYRLVLWWLIAIPTIREYNTYLQDRYNFEVTWFRFFFYRTWFRLHKAFFAVISMQLGWPISSQHHCCSNSSNFGCSVCWAVTFPLFVVLTCYPWQCTRATNGSCQLDMASMWTVHVITFWNQQVNLY